MTFHLKESKATFSALKSRLFSAGKSPFQHTNLVFEFRISNSKKGIPEQWQKGEWKPVFLKSRLFPSLFEQWLKSEKVPYHPRVKTAAPTQWNLKLRGSLGRNWNKNLKTFASCYLQSPPTPDFTPLPPWFSWTWDFYKQQLKVGGGLALYT